MIILRKFCRQRFGAAGLAALLLAIVLLLCQAHPAVQIEPAAAAGPRSVAVCGTPFGVKMFSDGALVVASAESVFRVRPGKSRRRSTGLRLGDLIISAAGRPVHSNDDLSAALQPGQGERGSRRSSAAAAGASVYRGPARPLGGCLGGSGRSRAVRAGFRRRDRHTGPVVDPVAAHLCVG